MTLPCSEAQRTLQKPPFHPLQSADEQPEAAGRLGKRSQTFQVSVQGSSQHPDHLSRTLYDSLSRLGCPQASIYLLHHPTSHTHNSLPPPHTQTHTHTHTTITTASLTCTIPPLLSLPLPFTHLQLISGSPWQTNSIWGSSSLGATLVLHLHLKRARPTTCSACNTVKEAEPPGLRMGRTSQWLLSPQIMARMGPGSGQTPAQSPQEKLP